MDTGLEQFSKQLLSSVATKAAVALGGDVLVAAIELKVEWSRVVLT